MPFSHLRTGIPDGFATDEFVLRPIAVADTELDYAAVMESRAYLRPWEQSGWPADDFTLEDDRADVEMLERRHLDRRAFTYTVLDPDETECLGCVYLMPPDASSFASSRVVPLGDGRWEDCGAAVYFWVRTSRLASGLDRRLLDAVRDWLRADWDLAPCVVVTNEQVPQQVALLEGAGLRARFRIERDDQEGAYLAYA